MAKNLSYFQGKIIPSEKAMLNIQTHALQYGTMVFGGIRAYYNSTKKNLYIFRLDEHAKRLLNSAKMLQLQIKMTEKELKQIIFDLVLASGYKENIYLRPFIYTSALQLSPRFHDVKADLAIYILPLNDYLDTKKGLRTMISTWRRIDDNSIPTMSKAGGGYVNSALAKSEAVQNGLDEAIFLDSKGYVSEGSAENIFIVRDGKIITPSLSSSILEGITRKSLIEFAKKDGFEVIEREVTRGELYTAEEVFFSGTGVQVAWVSEIDKRMIGNGKIGEVTKKIQDKFFKIVHNEFDEYSHWLTKIY